MITLNNVNFAKDKKELKAIKASGYYKRFKRQIELYDTKFNKIGVIVGNVLGKATLLDDGKYWYSYGTIDLIGEYKNESDELKKLIIGRDALGFIYK
jgi:hypothetical protein